MSTKLSCDGCGRDLHNYSSASLELRLGCYHGGDNESKRFARLFNGDLCPECGELLRTEARKAVARAFSKPTVEPEPKKLPWYKRGKVKQEDSTELERDQGALKDVLTEKQRR